MVLTVGEFVQAQGQYLHLKLLAGGGGLKRRISAMEVNRPGLALMGHLERFRAERIQVIGRGEESFLRKLNHGAGGQIFRKIFGFRRLPCFVVTSNLAPSRLLLDFCERHKVPLFQSALETEEFVGELHSYLESRLAPFRYFHGVLVEVYGLGVLICGKSGVGKSECALELLKRGHFFIGDDLIKIKRLPGEILIGEAAREDFGSYMEVRGLGVINVASLFGIGSVMDSTRIELVVTFEIWQGPRVKSNYERVGLTERTKKILGAAVPHVTFPVFPGRNLAILLEVASLNQRLKNKGVYSAIEFEKKILEKTAGAKK
ncbi:MAG: HPr(Ser) kinase/phosphatase [Elusimicrobia bacterium]|nr:HPr(Ser) kinase/phosphatase [Elusimicrobiota bacterium]